MQKVLAIFMGPLLGYALTTAIMNPSSIAAAGAFVGAGLFAVAISLCRDGAVPSAPCQEG